MFIQTLHGCFSFGWLHLVHAHAHTHVRLIDWYIIEVPGVDLTRISSRCMSGLAMFKISMPTQNRAGARRNPRANHGKVETSRLASPVDGITARKMMLMRFGVSSHLPSGTSHCARPILVACYVAKNSKWKKNRVHMEPSPCPSSSSRSRNGQSTTSRAAVWRRWRPL